LKNIQIIDGALNATFSVFQATEEEFAAIFPAEGQDMELIEDFLERVGEEQARSVLQPIWERPILKRDAHGIHGTLYYQYADRRGYLPATRREVDWDDSSINFAQRRLFASKR
jgi:hypothetical protein